MKKIYFLSLVFTIGFCLALGSCRSGNRKKQNPVATQTDRSNIRYAQGFWLEQHENYRLLHIKDPQSETGSEYTFALRQRGTHPELPPHIPVLDLPIRGVICMTSLQLSNFIKLGATSQVVGISSTRFLNNATIKQQLAEGKTQKIGIEVNFDAFNPGFGRYAYNLVHCNADWTQSNLSPIEYMNGFQGSTIEDFANAMGTTVQYTNYRLLFPNDDVQPKVSGNYALQVYNEDDPSQIVFTACFSIFEPMVSVAATVSGNTDIDTNQSHQQVSFAINNKNFPITYPQTDLKIWVYQNNRRDNAVTGLQDRKSVV